MAKFESVEDYLNSLESPKQGNASRSFGRDDFNLSTSAAVSGWSPPRCDVLAGFMILVR